MDKLETIHGIAAVASKLCAVNKDDTVQDMGFRLGQISCLMMNITSLSAPAPKNPLANTNPAAGAESTNANEAKHE